MPAVPVKPYNKREVPRSCGLGNTRATMLAQTHFLWGNDLPICITFMHSRQLKPLPCNQILLRSKALSAFQRQRGDRLTAQSLLKSLLGVLALLSLSTLLRSKGLSAFQRQSGDQSPRPSFLAGQFGISELQHWDGLHGVRSGVSRVVNTTVSLCGIILGWSSRSDIGSLLGLVAAATPGIPVTLRLLIAISVCLGRRLKQVSSVPLSLKSLRLAKRLSSTGMRSGGVSIFIFCLICVTASMPLVSLGEHILSSGACVLLR